MKRFLLSFLILTGGVLHARDALGTLLGPPDDDFSAKTKVDLLVELAEVKPGTIVTVGLHLRMPEKWHTYWNNPGDSGDSTKMTWENLPEGITAGAIQWPVPEKVEWLGMFTYAYHHDVLLMIPLKLSADVKPGEYELKGKVEWLECEESCLPGDKQVSATLVVGKNAESGLNADLFEAWRKKLPDAKALPAISARWTGKPVEGKREIAIEAPFGKGAVVAFIPDATESKAWKISHDSVQVIEAENTLIRKTVESEQGEWPAVISGVLRVELDGAVQGYRTEVQIGNGEETAGSTVTAEPVQSIWLILGGAFLGGLILNIMPCVLPVISLKILGFVQQSQESPERLRKLGLTYALGVWASFLALAGVLISAKNSTQMASWGMQMQSPYFNLVLLLVVVLVALNLFGVFEVVLGGSTMTKASELSSREGFMAVSYTHLTLPTICSV